MRLRPAQPADALNVARVHVRSWQVAYRKLMPAEYLDQLRPEERALRYDFANSDPARPFTIVAEEDGVISGFATIAPARDQDVPDHGELYALYVDPDRWGNGIGVRLIAAARAGLRDRGFHQAVLWVLAGNSRAERFYAADHWTPDGLRRTDCVWNMVVDEVRYRRNLP